MTAGGCAGGEVEELPPIEPYLGYFMSVRSGTIYLFEAFEDKQAYDANRLDEGAPFRAFVDRAGDRVMILAAEPIDLEARQQERTAEEQALAVLRATGADALVVGTISAYDPYDPPKVGLTWRLSLPLNPI